MSDQPKEQSPLLNKSCVDYIVESMKELLAEASQLQDWEDITSKLLNFSKIDVELLIVDTLYEAQNPIPEVPADLSGLEEIASDEVEELSMLSNEHEDKDDPFLGDEGMTELLDDQINILDSELPKSLVDVVQGAYRIALGKADVHVVKDVSRFFEIPLQTEFPVIQKCLDILASGEARLTAGSGSEGRVKLDDHVIVGVQTADKINLLRDIYGKDSGFESYKRENIDGLTGYFIEQYLRRRSELLRGAVSGISPGQNTNIFFNERRKDKQ